jgi:hypothetical protein
VSYLFAWPVIFAAAAALLKPGREVAQWVAAIITLLILVGFTYGVSVVMLGVGGVGAIALCVITALVSLLLAPQLEIIAGNARLLGAPWLAGAGALCLVFVALGVHPSADHPVRTALVYAQNVESSDAWLGTFGGVRDDWTRAILGATPARAPAWTSRLSETGGRFIGRSVQRVPRPGPTATMIGDTIIASVRTIELRVTAPPGTTGLVMRARGAKVLASAIDGRAVDTTRYRIPARDWIMQYWAVPDSGAIVAISFQAGSNIDFDLAARQPGIPQIPGVNIPPRPPSVVPSQTGDVSIVYRQWRY